MRDRIVIGFDFETYANGWDNKTKAIYTLTPEPVCLSLAGRSDSLALYRRLVDGADPEHCWHRERKGWWEIVVDMTLAETFLAAADDFADIMVAQNLSFDAAEARTHMSTAMTQRVARGYRDGRWRCTMIREQLLCIAMDCFKFDRRRKKHKNKKGEWVLGGTRYGLDYLVKTYLGRDISATKSDPNAWRLRYGELHNVPLNEWPIEALTYASMDSTYAGQIFRLQGKNDFEIDGYPLVVDGDIVDEIHQTRADLVLHEAACHGVRIDPDKAEEFRADAQLNVDLLMEAGKKLGIVVINRCKTCDGTGKTGRYPNHRTCSTCKGHDHARIQKDNANHLACGHCKGAKNRKGHAQGCLVGRKTAPKPTHKKTRQQELVVWGYQPAVNDPMSGVTGPPRTAASDKYPNGQVQTDKDAFLGMVRTDEAIQTYTKGLVYAKYLSTYYPAIALALLHNKGILHSRPRALVRSGRTSWSSPNLQNPPRDGLFRECFVAREGMVFAAVDYSGQETVCLAQVLTTMFGKSVMAEVLNAGRDLHLWTAAAWLNITYEEAVRRRKEPAIKKARQQAKVPNFGCPGGLGWASLIKFARGMGVELDEAASRELIARYKKDFPEMRRYFDTMSRASNTSGGRFVVQQHYSNRLRGGCYYTSACNTLFQGLGADATKRAMWRIWWECNMEPESPLFGCNIWLMVHDEVILEGPEETAHLWAPRVTELMVEEQCLATPDMIPAVKAPPALMRRWYKEADDVYDTDGKLIPWEPQEKAA